ncbi:MAG: hypothetical protein R3E79_07090 [Caldilineaceae bacterium]
MQALWDFLDNYIYGPLNYIDRIEGLIKAAKYHDSGHCFAIPRHDKGSKHSLRQVEELLNTYGIAVFCRTFDADNHYFRVKNRQAEWAEYLMLLQGVELQGILINEQNAYYAAKAPIGWMPQPWSAKNTNANNQPNDSQPSSTKNSTSDLLLNKLQDFIDWD